MDPVEFERRLRTLEDIEAIRSLKSAYFAASDRKDPQAFRACFVDGPVHIDYGRIGTFDNADALTKIYTEIACHDHMVELHHGSNPQIEITGPQTARGTWSLHYFLAETRAKTLTQLAGHYEDEYRKTAKGWKISRTKFTVTSTVAMDYSDAAAKVMFAGSAPPG